MGVRVGPEELVHVERELRGLLTENGLGWVLASVDDALTEGILQEKTIERPRRRRQRETVHYQGTMGDAVDVEYVLAEPGFRAGSAGGSRADSDTGITVRPYSARERLLLTIESTQRVIAELPAAVVSTRVHLAEAAGAQLGDVTVKFVSEITDTASDQDDQVRAESIGRQERAGLEAVAPSGRRLEEDPEYRDSLVAVLDRLKDEVRLDDGR
ncbi:hypothetical protein [Actinoplanes subtropicus]|uniref:hypothetical protein n=1 Tax=Actinoplanes subtropicus TaxID=543632 RepID=UPI0004C2DAC6|nr:hypothetical protein [Actinoplanes subtropicus]